jgi:RNA polymerase-binding transcription factor DksA
MSSAFTLADLETSEAEIAAVERAIADLEAGTYGVCLTCGADISDVVRSNPLTTECVSHHAPLTLSLDADGETDADPAPSNAPLASLD